MQHLARLDKANTIQQADVAKLLNAVQAAHITLTNLRQDVDALIAHTAKTTRRAR